MAVQAQYPASIATAFRVDNNNNNVSMENFHQDHHLQYGHHQVFIKKNGTVFSDPEIMSELTCNFVSASTNTNTIRKRKNTTTTTTTSSRGGDDDQMPPPYQQYLINPQHQHNYNYYGYFPANCSRTTKLPKLDPLISAVCVKKSVEENRLNQQYGGGAGASTNGQRRRSLRYHHNDDEDAVLLVSSSSPQVPPPPLPPQHSQHLNSSSSSYYNNLLHQNLDDEIDALIRLQHQALRSVVEQRQCRLLVSVLEQQVVLQRRLKEKQIELENAWGRNAELEQKVEQMTSENQMWFNVANNNEAMVLRLRSTLEHQLLIINLHHQNQNTTKKAMGLLELEEEGFGDSSDQGVAADDDAQSSNNNNCHHEQLHLQMQVNVGEKEYKTVNRSSNVDVRADHDDDASMMMMMMMMKKKEHQQQQQHRKMCKVCNEIEVSVLLLPCRHLCLCKDCEAKLQACPICNSFKNASLQIFMS